jgi:hypothetical protein
MAWYDDYQAPAQKGLGSLYGMARGPYGLQGGYMPGDLLKGQLGGYGGGMGGPGMGGGPWGNVGPGMPQRFGGGMGGMPQGMGGGMPPPLPGPVGAMPVPEGIGPPTAPLPPVDAAGNPVIDPNMRNDPGQPPNPYVDPSGFETWLQGRKYGPTLQQWQSRLDGANPVFGGSMNGGMGAPGPGGVGAALPPELGGAPMPDQPWWMQAQPARGVPGVLQQQLMRGY